MSEVAPSEGCFTRSRVGRTRNEHSSQGETRRRAHAWRLLGPHPGGRAYAPRFDWASWRPL